MKRDLLAITDSITLSFEFSFSSVTYFKFLINQNHPTSHASLLHAD